MPRINCPICNRLFDPEKSESLPFCSDRCRLIDLSRWLDEKYALPAEQSDKQEPDEPPPDDS